MNRKDCSRVARVTLLLGLFLALAVILTAPRLVRADPGAPPATPLAQAQAVAGPRTITFAYDDAGRLAQADYGQGKTIAYTYDQAGNLLQRAVRQVFGVYLPVVLRNR